MSKGEPFRFECGLGFDCPHHPRNPEGVTRGGKAVVSVYESNGGSSPSNAAVGRTFLIELGNVMFYSYAAHGELPYEILPITKASEKIPFLSVPSNCAGTIGGCDQRIP